MPGPRAVPAGTALCDSQSSTLDAISCSICCRGDDAATLLMCEYFEHCGCAAHAVACLGLPQTPPAAEPWFCTECSSSHHIRRNTDREERSAGGSENRNVSRQKKQANSGPVVRFLPYPRPSSPHAAAASPFNLNVGMGEVLPPSGLSLSPPRAGAAAGLLGPSEGGEHENTSAGGANNMPIGSIRELVSQSNSPAEVSAGGVSIQHQITVSEAELKELQLQQLNELRTQAANDRTRACTAEGQMAAVVERLESAEATIRTLEQELVMAAANKFGSSTSSSAAARIQQGARISCEYTTEHGKHVRYFGVVKDILASIDWEEPGGGMSTTPLRRCRPEPEVGLRFSRKRKAATTLVAAAAAEPAVQPPAMVFCTICQDSHLKEALVQLNCGHSFCRDMLSGWANSLANGGGGGGATRRAQSVPCPTCRSLGRFRATSAGTSS